jgi:hypothetical protein
MRSITGWGACSSAFAARRERSYEVIREGDRWHNVFFDTSEKAARLREGHQRAREHDPTLGGFAALQTQGPDGLVADEAARRRYFGDDLA